MPVRFNLVARIIVKRESQHRVSGCELRLADCIARFQVPQATEWERIGDEIDDALVAARGAFRKVLASGLDARLLRLF